MGESCMTKFTLQASFLLLAVFAVSGCATKNLIVERQGAYQAYQEEDYAAAAEKFEELVEEIPKDAELWFRLGNSYAKIALPEKAIKAYQNALLRDPKMGKAWYNMGLIHLQAALKSFVDMDSYVAENDPVAKRGELMREGIFSLLETPADKNEHEN
jgi:tetratricopeptide (TPR) repeat protein